MTKVAWTPWHKVVKIRPDLKSGDLSLNVFAADLYDVAMGKAKPVYQEPKEFFSLTYPPSICASTRSRCGTPGQRRSRGLAWTLFHQPASASSTDGSPLHQPTEASAPGTVAITGATHRLVAGYSSSKIAARENSRGSNGRSSSIV
jgi:hypothetical protein